MTPQNVNSGDTHDTPSDTGLNPATPLLVSSALSAVNPVFNDRQFQLSQQNLRELDRSVSPCAIPQGEASFERTANQGYTLLTRMESHLQPSPSRLGPNMDYPNFVEVIQEQIDLRIASSDNPTAVMELDMDGNVRHLSRNWERIVGTDIKKIVNKPILSFIIGNEEDDKMVFHTAIEHMIRDDGSYKVKFITATNDRTNEQTLVEHSTSSGKSTPNNSLVDVSIDPQQQELHQQASRETQVLLQLQHEQLLPDLRGTSSLSDLTTNGDFIELEAQGILIHDNRTKLPTHSMWTVRPFTAVSLDLQLPAQLVNLLGFGSEFFEGYLMNLNELGIIDEESVPQPKSILCRICEQQVPVWFIERHSELCLVEHRYSEELQNCHDLVSEQRDLILQISEALWRQQQSQLASQLSPPPQHQPQLLQLTPVLPRTLPHHLPLAQHANLSQSVSPLSQSPMSSTSSLVHRTISNIGDYKGIPLPSVSSSELSPRIAPQSSNRNNSILQSMFHSKKFPFGILQRLVELCEEALQINAVDESSADGAQLSPHTEEAIKSVMNWKVFETNDLAIRAMVEDTQRFTRDKIEMLSRQLSFLQFLKRIKAEVDELVLLTVRETVSKIREQVYIKDNGQIEEGLDQRDSLAGNLTSSNTEIDHVSYNDSNSSLQNSLALSDDQLAMHYPQPERLLSLPTNETFGVSRPGLNVDDYQPSMPQSVTPQDFLLKTGPYHTPNASSPSFKPAASTNLQLELSLMDSMHDLKLSKLRREESLKSASEADGHTPGGNNLGGSRSSGSVSRGRDYNASGSPFASRRHLSPAPYVEKPSLSSFQKNTNARFDTSHSTPLGSPSIQHTDLNNEGIPMLSLRRTNSGSNLSTHSQAGLTGTGEVAAGLSAPGSGKSGSYNKPPLSPLLVSQTIPSKPSSGSIKDYEILKAISKGAFGSVFLARRKLTGDYVAIKCLKKTDMIAKNQVLNVKSERAVMMRQSDSPYVAQLYSSFQTKDYLYLVMEYLNGGDCATLLQVLGTLGNQWSKRYIAEVIVGVEDLHQRGIIHRDLKPDNLLIDSKGHIKLTDFGLSRMGVVGRQTASHRKSSASEQSVELFRKSINQLSSPLNALSWLSPGSASASGQGGGSDFSKEHHKRTSSVTPISLSPTLEFARLAGPASSPGDVPANNGLGHRPSLSGFRQRREGSNSSGLESPLLKPVLSKLFSDNSFAVFEDDFLVPASATVNNITSYALYDPQNDNEDIKKFVGTPDYLAPETITGEGQNEVSDWWSIGCILFEFIYGYPPFHADSPQKVFKNILACQIDWPPLPEREELEICPPDCKDLIKKLLTLDPTQRLGNNGADEIRSHPYFANINWDTLFEEVPLFVPTPENPESTDYFDARGADISQFPKDEEFGQAVGEPFGGSIKTSELGSPSAQQLQVTLNQVGGKVERRGSRLADNSEFGSFNFRNLSVLEKANKDVINRLKNEHLEHRNSFSTSSDSASSSSRSRGYSITSASSPFKKPSSPQLRATSPARYAPHQHPNDMHIGVPSPQIFGHNALMHERAGSAASTFSSGDEFPFEVENKLTSGDASAIYNNAAPASGSAGSGISPTTAITGGGNASSTHRPSISSLSKQVFKSVNDFSPSSSDNEDTKSSALLRVRKRRQSARRPASFSLQGADSFSRPTFQEVDVLYCEPIPIVRHSIARILERLGCIVVAVADGDELVRRATGKVKFDIIFTALRLPKVEAPDAVKLIRYTSGVNSNTPVVAITGYAKEAQQAKCFDEVLEKPTNSNEVRNCLVEFCNWGPLLTSSQDAVNDEAIESDTERL